jgi:hypothetical protein
MDTFQSGGRKAWKENNALDGRKTWKELKAANSFNFSNEKDISALNDTLMHVKASWKGEG